MKSTNITLSNIKQTGLVSFLCCLLIAAIMPSYSFYLPPFMILWGVAWLFENDLKLDLAAIKRSKPGILLTIFLCFYFWQIAGLLFSDSIDSGVERIVKRLSFLMFSLVLFSPGERIKKRLDFILKIYTLSAFFYVIYCIINAFYNSVTFVESDMIFNPHPTDYPYENFFISNRFATAGIHATYISVYLVFSILVALENAFNKGSGLKIRLTWIIITVFLLTGVYLFSSRTAFIALLLVLPVYLFFKWRRNIYRWILYSFMFILFLLLGWIILTNQKIRYDVDKLKSEELQNVIGEDIRITIWKSALEVIKQNPVFGVGTGDAHDELTKNLRSAGYNDEFYKGLDTHNQFLEIQLENGIIGLLLFLLLITYMMYIAVSDKNLIYGLFIVICIVFFLFETSLNRLAGITFFSFFSFLLLHYRKE